MIFMYRFQMLKQKFFLLLSGLFIITATVLSGCEHSDIRLTITNRSNTDISVLCSNHSSLHLTENNIDFFLLDNNIIKPDSTNFIRKFGKSNSWHNYINEGPDKKLFIYVFALDTLIKYKGLASMDELCYHHKYLKEYEH